MGLVIRTNSSSLNSCRNLKKNNKKNAESLEKLASGYAINRAGDDAAGLGITEKMRAQISALDTIVNGCEDGVNLVRTADGYMSEIQDMIVRMEELAMKSSNGILKDVPDRQALQEEMDHLCAEVDRIAETANFNGNKLLDGKNATFTDIKGTGERGETYIPYSNAIKDVVNFPEDKCITGANDAETVRFLSGKIKNYVNANSSTTADLQSCLANKKIYYTADGKNVFIGANNMSDADVKTNLGIDANADYLSGEINNIYEPDTPSYSVSLTPSQYATTGGDATIRLLDDTIRDYLTNHSFDDLTGKRVYYKNDGTSAFVGDSSASPGSDYKSTPISIHRPYKSYSSFRVKSVKTLKPITLQIGETAEKADKLNVPLYDLHTDSILKGEMKLVAVTRPYQNSGSQGGASLSGNQNNSNTNVS